LKRKEGKKGERKEYEKGNIKDKQVIRRRQEGREEGRNMKKVI